MLGLHRRHLLQALQHAPQVSDAVVKGDLLVLARMGTLQQFPYVYLHFLLFRSLLPEKRDV